MANWDVLKSDIQRLIAENGNQEITGLVLQNTLVDMVTKLGSGATFMGIADPDTNPGTPDGPVFYIAVVPGTYTNLGGETLTGRHEFAIFTNISGDWNGYFVWKSVYESNDPTNAPGSVLGNQGYFCFSDSIRAQSIGLYISDDNGGYLDVYVSRIAIPTYATGISGSGGDSMAMYGKRLFINTRSDFKDYSEIPGDNGWVEITTTAQKIYSFSGALTQARRIEFRGKMPENGGGELIIATGITGFREIQCMAYISSQQLGIPPRTIYTGDNPYLRHYTIFLQNGNLKIFNNATGSDIVNVPVYAIFEVC